MITTSTCKNSSNEWCGLDHAEVGTRIARKTDMSPQYTVEAVIILEVCILESYPMSGFTLANLKPLVLEILESFRTEDFDVEYRSVNRFRFMGNGRTLRESRGEYYVLK
jgi:hypothetical protein